jgi:hypothetical protein
VTTMAIQKKSLIGKRQSVKKALVAKRVSVDAPKASQIKAPMATATNLRAPMAIHQKALSRFAPFKSISAFRTR